MQPAQPPLRPRPNPGPVDVVPELPSVRPRPVRPRPTPRPASPVATRDEPIRAPGLAAALRRHPRRVQLGYAAAVAGGLALFVAGALASPAPRAHLAEAPVHPAPV